MSIRLMALVWEYQFSHPEQSIMLALADHAQDDGSKIFPSVARIAWKTNYSERQVQRILRDLEAKEILVPVRHQWGGRGFATEYLMQIEKGDKKTPFRKKGDGDGGKGDILDTMGDIEEGMGDVQIEKGDVTMAPQPSQESSLQTSRETPALARPPSSYQEPHQQMTYDEWRKVMGR